jgi:hypothetical protein
MARTKLNPIQIAPNNTKAQITSNFSTASTTSVQVTGLSCTVTVPANANLVKITFWTGFIDNNSTAFVEATIWDGTVGSGTQLALVSIDINATNTRQIPVCMVALPPVPAAGSKTYNVGLRSTAGTGFIFGATTSPAFLLVEIT